jgi:hypothetical protein
MKGVLGLAVLLVLVGGGCSTKQSLKTNQPVITKNIIIEDVAAFFNKHSDFDCTKLIKSAPKSRDCFTKDFKSLYPEGVFGNPSVELVDFTGDGNLDAYVTIRYNGTGNNKDFYALTNDANGIVSQVYKESGYGRFTEPEVTVFSFSREMGIERKFLGWNKEKNTFVPLELLGASK